MARIARAFGGQIVRLSGPRGASVTGQVVRGSSITGTDNERSLGGIIPPPRSPFLFPEGSRGQSSGFQQAPPAAPPRFRLMPVGSIFRRSQLGQPDQGR